MTGGWLGTASNSSFAKLQRHACPSPRYRGPQLAYSYFFCSPKRGDYTMYIHLLPEEIDEHPPTIYSKTLLLVDAI